MKTNIKQIFLLSCFIVSSIGISNAQMVVKVRPAKPKVLVVKPAKAKPGHVWRNGHWVWNAKRKNYVWRKATWVKVNPGHAWMAGHWVRSANGHKWVPGYWKTNTRKKVVKAKVRRKRRLN